MKEQLKQTGVVIQGIVMSSNHNERDGKHYYSVDLVIKDHSDMVRVSLPESYDKASLVVGDLAKIPVIIRKFNNKLSLSARA